LCDGSKEAVRRLVAFGVVGVISTAIYAAFTIFFTEAVSLGPTASSAIAYGLSFVFSFSANHHFVFRSKESMRNTVVRFLGVSVFGLLLTSATMSFIVDVCGFDYFYGIATVVVLIPTSNFVLHHFWTFGKRNRTA
jgi:putative flippase GtrA